ncbi:E3 ubiquitin-protein ligase TRIM45-like [Glandiceps talaboti]
MDSDNEDMHVPDGVDISGSDSLKCPLGEHYYNDPVLLPCLCSICRPCLPKLAGDTGMYVCPTCKEKNRIPVNKFQGLSRNVLIKRRVAATGSETGEQLCENDGEVVTTWCPDCLQFFCQTCLNSHDRVAVCKDHAIIRVEELNVELLEKYRHMVVCKAHRTEADRLCTKCNTMVCKGCTVNDHSADYGHHVLNLEMTAKHYRDKMMRSLQGTTKRSKMLQSRLKYVTSKQDSLETDEQEARTELDQLFRKLNESFKDYELRMETKLDAAYGVQEEDIKAKQKEIKKMLARIKEARDMTRELLHAGDDIELVEMMAYVATRIEYLCNYNERYKVTDDQSARFEKDGSKIRALQTLVSQVGEVKTSLAIPPTLIKPGFGTGSDDDGDQQLGKISSHQFKAEISDPDDIFLPCWISTVRSGTYLCNFRPQIAGEHTIQVKMNGRPINGSPLSFFVHENNLIGCTSQIENEAPDRVKPIGITVDLKGNSYVTYHREDDNSEIVVYDDGLEYLTDFQLSCSMVFDVEVDHRGHLVVSEHHTNKVRIYTTKGKEVGKIEHKKMKKPCGVAVNSKNNILVADSQARCILVFLYKAKNRKGQLLLIIGESGSGRGQLGEPTFLAVDHLDAIYVSDRANDKVVTYSHKGVCGGEIKASGHGRGKVISPTGVARDRHGNVLVCGANNKVMIYTATGGFVACIDSDDEPLTNPHGLATTDDGFVLVVDTDTKCIKKFRYL